MKVLETLERASISTASGFSNVCVVANVFFHSIVGYIHAASKVW